MNALSEIVNIMSSDDKQAFIVHLKKKNKRQDVQNISLFKSLETDDINLLKNKISSDAYHALRKRLYESLIEFLGKRKFETDTSQEHEVMRLQVIAKVFFEHKLYREAFKCLSKAEAKALALEDFSLLNSIYHTRIQFAHFDTTDLETTIQKFNANKQKLEQEEQMNIAYALLRQELREIYHRGKVTDFRHFIEQTMKQQGVSTDALTYKSLYQILLIANEYASMNSNYKLIEPFIAQAYQFISEKETLGEKNLYYHIYVLYLLANMQFRNFRFAESETFLEKMEEQMQKQAGRYYNRFYLRYVLLLVLNKNYSGNPGMAIDMAEKALKKHSGADMTDVNDLRLALLVFYLQQSDRTAFRLMVQFGQTDSWYEKHMGMDWAIKKKLVELVLHAHFGNSELAIAQVKSFRKRYKKYLLEVQEERVLAFVEMVNQYLNKPERITTPGFLEAIRELDERTGREDVFAISFIGWLKSKAERKGAYETILRLIDNSPSEG